MQRDDFQRREKEMGEGMWSWPKEKSSRERSGPVFIKAVRKRADHRGSLTAASRQFNLTPSEANNRAPAEALQLWTLGGRRRDAESQKWKKGDGYCIKQ